MVRPGRRQWYIVVIFWIYLRKMSVCGGEGESENEGERERKITQQTLLEGHYSKQSRVEKKK